IKARCVQLIQRLGLKFGSMDIILTPDDRYVFLENNVQGQWLWIDERVNLGIGEALAQLLVEGRAG
ncbi:MAG: MvdC/MvdD family ATP grasp protein, partial [Myxococcaceae bacterium]